MSACRGWAVWAGVFTPPSVLVGTGLQLSCLRAKERLGNSRKAGAVPFEPVPTSGNPGEQ